MLIEIATFRLADGVDEEEFLAADQTVQQEFWYRQAGFVRRTTARGMDGSWAVVTLWGSATHADAAAERAQDDRASVAFSAVIDGVSRMVERYETLD